MNQKSLNERKLLMRLSQKGYELRAPLKGREENWRLFYVGKGGRPGPGEQIDEGGRGMLGGRAIASAALPLVKKLLASGCLIETASGAELSKAGRIALKRLLQQQPDCVGQHSDMQDAPLLQAAPPRSGERAALKRNMAESPFTWLATRRGQDGKRLIEPHQLLAGERLRADFERASLMGKTGRNWDRLAMPHARMQAGGSDGLSLTEGGMAARQRFYRAVEMVGEELAPALITVCCEQLGLEDAERRHGWPKRAGKVILKMALDRLARHYGLIGSSGRGKGVLTHWGEADYRPSVD